MTHDYCGSYEDITIRPLHRYDIAILRKWRNDKSTTRFLTPLNEITEDSQEKWYGRYLTDDDLLFFSIVLGQMSPVGTVALYGFQENKCSIGKLLVDEKLRGNNLGRRAFLLVMSVANTFLGVDRFKLTVSKRNAVAYHIYDKLGFRENGNRHMLGELAEIEMEASFKNIIKNNVEIKYLQLFKEDGMEMGRFLFNRGGYYREISHCKNRAIWMSFQERKAA